MQKQKLKNKKFNGLVEVPGMRSMLLSTYKAFLRAFDLEKGKQLFINTKISIGTVLTVADGVARVDGLKGAGYLHEVVFKTSFGNIIGMVMDLRPSLTNVIVFGREGQVRQGDFVYCWGNSFSVPVGPSLLGRVVDALGRPVDGGEAVSTTNIRRIEIIAPGIIARQPVNQPVQTGIKVIDSMFPIGRGQRELIIGDRGTGKTAVSIDSIISQTVVNRYSKEYEMVCIYVAIGQKESSVAEIERILRSHDAMKFSTIVNAPAWDAVGMRYIAAYSGCTMGEYFRDNGRSCLIIYDDLTQHAVSYREMSLILRRPPGREAYPGDVFYLHSRLLERAARLSNKLGGGSLTALPVIETQEGEVSAYIPTNVISITDGQIYMEPTLFNQGIKPAVNTGLSVSRVGSAAQVKQLKNLCKSLKIELANYREVLGFAHFASELDDATRQLLHRGGRLVELLKQAQFHILSVEEQIITIFCGVNGYLDSLELNEIGNFQANLLKFVSNMKIISPIVREAALSLNTDTLRNLIEYFKHSYLKTN